MIRPSDPSAPRLLPSIPAPTPAPKPRRPVVPPLGANGLARQVQSPAQPASLPPCPFTVDPKKVEQAVVGASAGWQGDRLASALAAHFGNETEALGWLQRHRGRSPTELMRLLAARSVPPQGAPTEHYARMARVVRAFEQKAARPEGFFDEAAVRPRALKALGEVLGPPMVARLVADRREVIEKAKTTLARDGVLNPEFERRLDQALTVLRYGYYVELGQRIDRRDKLKQALADPKLTEAERADKSDELGRIERRMVWAFFKTVHTSFVFANAVEIVARLPHLDPTQKPTILEAALLHDAGCAYEQGCLPNHTEDRADIDHGVVGSDVVRQAGYPPEVYLAVQKHNRYSDVELVHDPRWLDLGEGMPTGGEFGVLENERQALATLAFQVVRDADKLGNLQSITTQLEVVGTLIYGLDPATLQVPVAPAVLEFLEQNQMVNKAVMDDAARTSASNQLLYYLGWLNGLHFPESMRVACEQVGYPQFVAAQLSEHPDPALRARVQKICDALAARPPETVGTQPGVLRSGTHTHMSALVETLRRAIEARSS